MGVFDLFRAKWKHSNKAVREAAVAALSVADAAILADVARHDPEPHIRSLALKKIDVPELLLEVAGHDLDEAVRLLSRERANQLLCEQAIASSHAGQATPDSIQTALSAVAQLTDPAALCKVAQRAASTVAVAALARLDAPKLLVEVARHGTESTVRLQAVDELHDPTLLYEIAVGEVPAELALRALGRITVTEVTERASLELLAKRAVRKAVRSTARAMLEQLEATSKVAQEPPSLAAVERARKLQLCKQAERTSELSDLRAAVHQMHEAEAAWQADLADAPHDELTERFAQARAQLHDRLQSWRQKRATARNEASQAAAEPPVAPPAPAVAPPPLVVQESDSPPVEPKPSATEAEANRVGLEKVVAYLETLCEGDDPRLLGDGLREANRSFEALRPLPEASRPALEKRFFLARQALVARQKELREAAEWKRWANVSRLEQLCARAERLLEESEPKQLGRTLRALEAEWRQVGPVPRDRFEPLQSRFRAAVQQTEERCRVYFANLEAERLANLRRKEELCERVEALRGPTDWKEAAELVKQLQVEWKGIGPVPREQADALWQRFRGATQRFFAERKAHVAKLEVERAANLGRLVALCETVERFAESTDWKGAAQQIKAAQAEWKSIGPAPREQAEAVWKRFRHACDRFFERRKAYFEERDRERAANLEKKTALCDRIDALATESEEDGAEPPSPLLQDEERRAFEAEWRAIGPVPRADSERLRERFQKGCDRLSARRAQVANRHHQASDSDSRTAPKASARSEPSRFENRLPLHKLFDQARTGQADRGSQGTTDD